jgi:predicted ester cyclase
MGGNGNPVAFDEIRIDRFENGSIVESWFIPDRLTLFQALGFTVRPVDRPAGNERA